MLARSTVQRTTVTLAGVAAVLLTSFTYQAAAEPGAEPDGPERTITAKLRDLSSRDVGTARVTDFGNGARVVVKVSRQTPGYHGLHIHTVGLCEPGGGFGTAGGHMTHEAGEVHGDHAGDLPSLYVNDKGRGSLRFDTDAFTAKSLLDGDGSAVMIHAGRDNYANIPERYAPGGPDEVTLATGDAGARIVCGTLQK